MVSRTCLNITFIRASPVYLCVELTRTVPYGERNGVVFQSSRLAGLNCSNNFKKFLNFFLGFKRNFYFVCTHTINVVTLQVGFHELLVFLYYTFLPTFMCFYFPLCTRWRHDMNIYDLIILRYVVRRLRKSGV